MTWRSMSATSSRGASPGRPAMRSPLTWYQPFHRSSRTRSIVTSRPSWLLPWRMATHFTSAGRPKYAATSAKTTAATTLARSRSQNRLRRILQASIRGGQSRAGATADARDLPRTRARRRREACRRRGHVGCPWGHVRVLLLWRGLPQYPHTVRTPEEIGSTTSRREPTPAEASALDFSLVRGDGLHDAQRAARLMPLKGFGLGRRIGILVALTWLPLAIAAVLSRHAFEGTDPLLQHFGVHLRFLVAVPLFLLAEPMAEAVGRLMISYFLGSGLIRDSERGAFVEVIESSRRLLRSRWALLGVVVFVAGQAAQGVRDTAHMHEIHGWAASDGGHLGFAAWWLLLVSRPIYGILLFNWIWRLIVTVVLLARISRLDLQLVPTHPDGCGGLSFLQRMPTVFAPVVMASSAVLAGRWGHDVLYHGAPVQSLFAPMGIFVALSLVLLLSPLLVFAPNLLALKRQGLLTYGALVGRHGRLVERRWVRGETVADDGLLQAPELGPVADTLTLYEAVEKLRPVPIGKQSVVTVAAAAIIPMLPVIAIQVPTKDYLLGILKILLKGRESEPPLQPGDDGHELPVQVRSENRVGGLWHRRRRRLRRLVVAPPVPGELRWGRGG